MGFEIVLQRVQVGARFKALNEGVLMAPSVLPCLFVKILKLVMERCGLKFVFGFKYDFFHIRFSAAIITGITMSKFFFNCLEW